MEVARERLNKAIETKNSVLCVGLDVVVEKMPVMIQEARPVYPKGALRIGLEGSAWIKALVDSRGVVRKAMVLRSSESVLLDEAALNAAFKCRYKPAVQNGRPVAVWVTYRVDFVLN